MALTYYVRPDGSDLNTGLGDSALLAWKTVKYAMQNASNLVILDGDNLYVVADQGNYTENNITWDKTINIFGLRGRAVIDGTGGGAGTNIINAGSKPCPMVDVVLQNAVAAGLNQGGGNGSPMTRCSFLTCGTQGITWDQAALVSCTIRGNGTTGIGTGSVTIQLVECEVSDNVSHGVNSYNNGFFARCVIKHNGGDGIHSANNCALRVTILGCSIDGNTSDGVEFASATAFPAGSIFLNNSVTNNGTYGVNASTVQTGIYMTDFNCFYGNGTPRNNFNVGASDISSDPLYVSGSDLTPGSGSPLIDAGYSAFKSPMKVNMGAVSAAAAIAGGCPIVGGSLVLAGR